MNDPQHTNATSVGGGQGPPAPPQFDQPASAPEPTAQVDSGAAAPAEAPPAAVPAPATPAPAAPLPPPPSAPPAAAPVVDAPPATPAKVMDAAWPFPGYTGPQAWEAENPPTLTQNYLMLSSGSSGPEVVELASLLAYLGYSTSISSGENPHAIYDSGISTAVAAFCNDYGVREDPQVLAARTNDTVGPWLWEALTRAVHKKAAATIQES
jgi:hypothetical protein